MKKSLLASSSQKILIMNWRDPASPLEGGAERFTLRYAEDWVAAGHTVYWLTNTFPGSKQQEKKNGISYLRIGPSLTGSLLSYLFYYPIYLLRTIWFANRFIKNKSVDVVVDEIHGLPFFTPFYSGARNVLLVCEVADKIWHKMFPFPISFFGSAFEKMLYRFYEKSEIWAISENTKQNIQALLPGKDVSVIDLGLDIEPSLLKKIYARKKNDYPTLIFLARLVPMKGIEVALRAIPELIKDFPSLKLKVLGRGLPEYEAYLKSLVQELGVARNVSFVGHKESPEKFFQLADSHFLLHPSYKEGFGLTAIEAGIVGTPAIIRSGSSLDALIENGVNGFSFESDEDLVDTIKTALTSKKYAQLRTSAISRADHYTWNKVLKRSRQITQL